MHIVLTVCSSFLLILGLAVVITGVRRIERLTGQCEDHANDAESAKLATLEDRHRITALERDLEATRRELRKLSGKFYAELRTREDETEFVVDDRADARWPVSGHRPLFSDDGRLEPPLVCENWKAAQTLGPHSDAAKCDCEYCTFRRNQRRVLRDALVPKTVQGQAETARLNAGKP